MSPVHTVLRNVTFLVFSQHVPSSHVICSSMTAVDTELSEYCIDSEV